MTVNIVNNVISDFTII